MSDYDSGKLNGYAGIAEGLLINSGLVNTSSIGIGTLLAHELFTPANALTELINLIATNSALFDEIYASEYSSQLDRITIPCAFLWGKYDFVVPSGLATDAFEGVSSTEKEIIIFDASGHSPMISESQRFVEEVGRFVERYK